MDSVIITSSRIKVASSIQLKRKCAEGQKTVICEATGVIKSARDGIRVKKRQNR
jgi:hypothetical protein